MGKDAQANVKVAVNTPTISLPVLEYLDVTAIG